MRSLHGISLPCKSGRKVEYVGAIDIKTIDASKADKKYVANAVNSLLKSQSFPVAVPKIVGCSIKWKP